MKLSQTNQDLKEISDVRSGEDSLRSRAVASIILSLVLSGCENTPKSHSSHSYEPKTIFIPLILTEPKEPKLINKSFSHNGPLGDPICTYLYDTKRTILKLCDYKPPKIIQKYTKDIPAKYTWVPGTTEYIAPKTVYGYNALTGKIENHWQPGRTISIPGKNVYTPAKTENCTKSIPFSQDDGKALPQLIECK